MSERLSVNSGCNDDFSELAALSIAGALTPDQWRRLEKHVRVCAQCASLLADYQSLAAEGMAKLGAVLTPATEEFNQDFLWARDEVKARLLSVLKDSATGYPMLRPPDSVETPPSPARISSVFRLSPATALGSIAAVLLVVTTAAYYVGLKRSAARSPQVSSSYLDRRLVLQQQLTDLQAQRAVLDERLAADSKTLAASEERAARAEKELARVQALEVSLETKAQELGNQSQQESTALEALATERDSLQQKLRDAESLLQGVRQDLSASQGERQKILLQSTTLETQIEHLSSELREREETWERQEQYLASDRDIRELMGARQLYIADVYDIDSRGKTRKPFGRVFYTQGKSLIFYAFDLDQQPGYREAKAFQAWGRQGSSQATPVSLGILYMDNESNRRWMLEFKDPRVLEEVNAVFVTVEPKGGSKKPTSKPFLLAYLHTAPPNHP
jgi:hypothetical protein